MKLLKHTRRIIPVIMLMLVFLLSGCNNASKIEKALILSETEFSIMEGESKTLTLNNPEDKDVGEYTLTWVAEDTSVATVKDDGTVTAVAPGTTKITAVVSTKKAEVYFDSTVTVTKNTTPLSSISFNTTVYSLGEGQTLNLNDEVVYYPTNAVNTGLIWKSSNTSIATVSSGVVTPVSEGISTITASTEDGRIFASCTVRVSEITVEPTGVSFEEEEYRAVEGKTFKLTAKVEPENATGYSILWTSSDPAVATVSGGTVTAVSVGEATITASLNIDNGRMTAQCTVIVDPAGEVSVPATKIQLTPASMTIPENQDGPFKFGIAITPANHTDRPVWTTNRSDILKIDASTGEFTVIKAPTDNAVAVLVTCTVGDLSSTGVVNINPRKPVLQIVGNETETLYNKAPLNTLELVAAFVDSENLPDVTWATSNTSVATVDATGMVTGHRVGQCTITAICKDDSSIRANYTVTVQKAPYISLTVGQTVTIDSSLIPNDPINWNSLATYVELDETNCTIKGLKETFDKPTVISCYSQATGEFYSVDIYILPEQ